MARKFCCFLSLIASLAVSAQTSSGVCRLPNQHEYVKVDYYDDGHLVISNQSVIPITELKVVVSCVQRWTTTHTSPYDGGAVYDQHQKTITLFNGTIYDVPTLQSMQYVEDVKPIRYSEKYRITDVSVQVGNLICK